MKYQIQRITKSILLLILLNASHFSLAQSKKEFYRYPSQNDSLLVEKNHTLFDSIPTNLNYQLYFDVAESFWNLNKNKEAKIMFTKIEQSDIIKFKKIYLNNSDVENDTSNATYGYGNFTFNFKNNSCLYLAKILIENKEFEKALKYIKLAEKEYIVEFNCGTGSGNYSNQLLKLYALSYEGLNQLQKVIELFMPNVFYHRSNTDILARVLKKKYSKEELKQINTDALNSIYFKIDDSKSNSYISINGELQKKSTYTSGEGFILLFNKEYKLPDPNLKDGETVTKEHFIKAYKNTRFYKDVFTFWTISFGHE